MADYEIRATLCNNNTAHVRIDYPNGDMTMDVWTGIENAQDVMDSFEYRHEDIRQNESAIFHIETEEGITDYEVHYRNR